MKKKIHKNFKTTVKWIVVVLVVVFAAGPFVFPKTTAPDDIRYGATWSTRYAQDLGVDPIVGFETAVNDLGISFFRIPVYWDRVELIRGVFNWEETDQLVAIAEANNVDLVLAIGQRVPRWPECFAPEWVETLSSEEKEAVQLLFVTEAIHRYKESPSLLRWQVENEPFLHAFGECPKGERPEFLGEEVDLVRELDPNHEIQMTASGELGLWTRVAKLTDVVGVSVYRTTYTKGVGYLTYPIPPWVYRAKARFIAPKHVVISELQAEPWFANPIESYSPQEQIDLFGTEDLKRHVQYAQRVGFDEVMLWGVEWWMYLKSAGHEELWEAAREIAW